MQYRHTCMHSKYYYGNTDYSSIEVCGIRIQFYTKTWMFWIFISIRVTGEADLSVSPSRHSDAYMHPITTQLLIQTVESQYHQIELIISIYYSLGKGIFYTFILTIEIGSVKTMSMWNESNEVLCSKQSIIRGRKWGKWINKVIYDVTITYEICNNFYKKHQFIIDN